MHTVYYTGDFKPVEHCIRRQDGIVDVWLRRNERAITDENGNIIKMAEEIYMKFNIDEAPSLEKLEDNIDKYFEKESVPETTIDDIMTAINELTDLILGGEEND